jgi:hypothetical protein
MDEQLAALVRSVESGRHQDDITVRVFLAGGAIEGVVKPSAEFAEMTEPAWTTDLSYAMKSGFGKRRKDETRLRASNRVNDVLSPLRETASPEHPSTLTLGPATFWPFGGKETVALPAIRVALDSVDAWCFLVGKVTSDSGGGWFVGGVVSDPFS